MSFGSHTAILSQEARERQEFNEVMEELDPYVKS